ncbi:sensor histidine kinase N-terminal domain-containing protein [Cereibacter sp. SYSU M97828]|nr:sensor histidine kinase N-terminal domain-containing protein [Cereibacter flavus]
MRHGYSLRRRLLAWLLVSTAIFGLAVLADTWREAIRTANSISDRILGGSALAIAERVTVTTEGQLDVDIPYSAMEMLTSPAEDRVFYRVDGPDGFLTGYEDLPRARPDEFFDTAFAGDDIRVTTLARQASTGAGTLPFTVTVAESTLARRELARSILLRSAARLSLMILCIAGIVWIAVTVALRPLTRLERAIAARSPDDLRPLAEDTPREVDGLVTAVNGFMRRLGTTLGGLRNFTGNASHQLRTPLAVVRMELELAARASGNPQVRAAASRGDAAVARAERILAQLLLLARVDAASATAPVIDIGALARRLTGDLVPEAAARGADLGYEGETARIRAQPVLLEEALRNLLDNALNYAGPQAEITVRVANGQHVALVVEDNGPGIPPERQSELTSRFARAGTGEGFGLGLAIVAEIAALFEGRIELGERPGGGLRVTLFFPAA